MAANLLEDIKSVVTIIGSTGTMVVATLAYLTYRRGMNETHKSRELHRLDLLMAEINRMIEYRTARALNPAMAYLQNPTEVRWVLEVSNDPLGADEVLSESQERILSRYFFGGAEYGRLEARFLRIQYLESTQLEPETVDAFARDLCLFNADFDARRLFAPPDRRLHVFSEMHHAFRGDEVSPKEIASRLWKSLRTA
ncbi:MAG: hypothetical protein JNM85_01860 [Chthonomonas sp.]|nr:hypothetical protein [Chthonomonas sp.]